MKVIRGFHNVPPFAAGRAVTLGNFDGVHRGHCALLGKVREAADARGLSVCAICFEPHPLEFLRPDMAPPRLMTLRAKLEALASCDVDEVLVLRFGSALASRPAEDFVIEDLVGRLNMRYIVVGDDYRFGQGRRGSYAMINALGANHGFGCDHLPTVAHAHERVSSTRIRNHLAAGEVSAANALLGRPYGLSGRVVHGDKWGRELGAPTANVAWPYPTALRYGVYCVRLDGAPAVANVGVRPSVNGQDERIEVHVLDASPELYGRRVHVTVEHFLRAEARFDSRGALAAAIAADIETARHWFASTTESKS